jgi:hypothetical protein
MTIPTVQVATELAAVNDILGAVGIAPVTSLVSPNPDVQLALNTLRGINQEVQSQGWVFNTESEYPLNVDVNGEVLIPLNVITVDLSPSERLSQNNAQVIVRNGKLYNKTDHIYTWTDSQIRCEILWLFPFEDCPVPFRDYVTARSSVVASGRLVGDPNQYRLLKDREDSSRRSLMEYECTQGNYTMFGPKQGMNNYNGFQPSKVLRR